MQTTSLLHVPPLSSRPFLHKFGRKKTARYQQKSASSCVFALKRDHHEHGKDRYSGRLVDDSMIVLRMRIHEMKMKEMNNDAPSNWMEWEKRWYLRYDSDVCEALGFLQIVLMETRPSLVLGMLVLLVLSVPTSFAFVLHYVMDFFR